MLATALVGVAVNIAAAWSISKANRTSLNVEGAFQHILTDLYGFIATAVAGLVVLLTGYARADAIATLVVVALMLKAGLGLVTAAGRIFLEAAPAGIDPDAVGDQMAAVEQVIEVHDLHIWEITSGQAALSAHVLVVPGGDCHKVRRVLQRQLLAEHGIGHATLQVDHLGEDADEPRCCRSRRRCRTRDLRALRGQPRSGASDRAARSLRRWRLSGGDWLILGKQRSPVSTAAPTSPPPPPRAPPAAAARTPGA